MKYFLIPLVLLSLSSCSDNATPDVSDADKNHIRQLAQTREQVSCTDEAEGWISDTDSNTTTARGLELEIEKGQRVFKRLDKYSSFSPLKRQGNVVTFIGKVKKRSIFVALELKDVLHIYSCPIKL